MRLRLKSVLAMLVTTGMLAGMLGFAQMAQARLMACLPPACRACPLAELHNQSLPRLRDRW